jgi:hypothetical protein
MIDSLEVTEIDLGWKREHEKVLADSSEHKMRIKKLLGIVIKVLGRTLSFYKRMTEDEPWIFQYDAGIKYRNVLRNFRSFCG